MREIQNAVRTRILDLTIELEKAVPTAAYVTLDKPTKPGAEAAAAVTQVFNQTIHGNYTGVTSTGASAQITLTISQGDKNALTSELERAGISKAEAKEFAEIVASEMPDAGSPFGERAREWLKLNLPKAIGGAWKIGVGVATTVFEAAAKAYYGLE
jgi:hypothetical protein